MTTIKFFAPNLPKCALKKAGRGPRTYFSPDRRDPGSFRGKLGPLTNVASLQTRPNLTRQW